MYIVHLDESNIIEKKLNKLEPTNMFHINVPWNSSLVYNID